MNEMEKVWNRLDDHARRITTLEASLPGVIHDEIHSALAPLVKITQDHERRLALLEQKKNNNNGLNKFWQSVVMALLMIIAALVGAKLPGLGLLIAPLGFCAGYFSILGDAPDSQWSPNGIPPPGGYGWKLPPPKKRKKKDVSEEDRPTLRKSIKTFLSTYKELHAVLCGAVIGLLIVLVMLHPGMWGWLVIILGTLAGGRFWEDVHYYLTPLMLVVLGWHLMGVIGCV